MVTFKCLHYECMREIYSHFIDLVSMNHLCRQKPYVTFANTMISQVMINYVATSFTPAGQGLDPKSLWRTMTLP